MEKAIKDWFMKKIKEQNADAFRCGELEDYSVVSETDKAYKFKLYFESHDGEYSFSRTVWVPKSCTFEVESVRQYEEESFERWLAERENAMQKGLEKYMRLYNFAIENGLKIRKRTKTKNILNALAEAGITYSEA